MNFWKRSIRQARPMRRDPARSRRAPSRSCQLQLEDLEGRALLSTWTLSETFGTGGVREVVVQFNNNKPTIVPITANPPPTFELTTGNFDTVTVLDTKAGVPILIKGNTQNTIDVGDLGSVQGILAPVTITDPTNWNTIFIDDQLDPAARTATLSTSAPGMGEVTGLAPAPITFAYSGTSSVYLETGTGPDIVNVASTGVGVTTNLVSNGGHDTVNVGSSGSVQSIRGTLNIENPPWFTTLNINDSADTAARTAFLSTFTPSFDPVPWGSITGLAPASINFAWGDVTNPVNISTSPDAVRWNVSPNSYAAQVGGVEVVDNGYFDDGQSLIVNLPPLQ